ncbi:MAG: DUF262 domain-containing protein [Dehalococcoidia bacterium]|jgi:hypothetical protein
MGTQMSIQELINAVGHDQYILPEFQRGYIWTETQVREYVTSLYRWYPTGSFLIWNTPKPGLVRGTLSSSTKAFQLILDGQQRLTSIYAVVTGDPPPFYEGEKLYFNLYFNVKTEQFSYYKKTVMKDSWEWVPVTEFLQHGLGDYLKTDGPLPVEKAQYLINFLDVLARLDRIKSYSYYLDVLSEREMDEAVKIFNFVNSKGTKLSKSDLALSHICALWPEARQTMRKAQDEFKQAGFDFGLDFYIRCTSCVATESGRYEPLNPVPAKKIQAAWERAKKALEYLLNVLRFDAFIDSSGNLATDMALVPLVVYLANGNGKFVSDTEKKNFLHWMFAALMWARYSGSTETKLDEDLRALKSKNPPERLRQNIIAERGRIKLEAQDLVGRTVQGPVITLCYAAARAAGAVDWFNGLPLYNKLVGKSNNLVYHHVFPQALLYKKGGFDSTNQHDVNRVNEIANIAFLTEAANLKIGASDPAKYLREVRAKYPKALAHQAIPVNPSLWEINRYEDFLAERRQGLANAINDFMDHLLAEEQPKPFTIGDYVAAGEGETVEFKGSLRWDHRQQVVNKALEKSIAKTIAGFMNKKGGTLVVGVGDRGEVFGLEGDFATLTVRHDRDGWEQALRNVLNTFLSKDIAATVGVAFSEMDGKTVAVVRADAALKPVYLEGEHGAEFHVRSGNTTQLLDVKQANEFISRRFQAIA